MRSNFQSLKLIHRGLAKKNFKENTLNAFRYCFKKKYGSIKWSSINIKPNDDPVKSIPFLNESFSFI